MCVGVQHAFAVVQGLVWFLARSLDPQLNVDLDLSYHDELDHVVNILSNGPRS